MKKRKSTKVDLPAAEPESLHDEPTNPNIEATEAAAAASTEAVGDFEEEEDTAVNSAPAELLQSALRPDEWDGPTTEAAQAEIGRASCRERV